MLVVRETPSDSDANLKSTKLFLEKATKKYIEIS